MYEINHIHFIKSDVGVIVQYFQQSPIWTVKIKSTVYQIKWQEASSAIIPEYYISGISKRLRDRFKEHLNDCIEKTKLHFLSAWCNSLQEYTKRA